MTATSSVSHPQPHQGASGISAWEPAKFTRGAPLSQGWWKVWCEQGGAHLSCFFPNLSQTTTISLANPAPTGLVLPWEDLCIQDQAENKDRTLISGCGSGPSTECCWLRPTATSCRVSRVCQAWKGCPPPPPPPSSCLPLPPQPAHS